MKRILITGKNSYIGISVENWLKREPEKYFIETLEMKDESWKEFDFSTFDVVFHVAGIAHVSTDPKMEELYYKVNRDLTIEVANKSKQSGVKQFIFMSSIIVYGDSKSSKRIINKDTIPTPSNFYGKSKLEAEEGILPLQSDSFNVVILRPPMIYGKGSKGNYPRLAKLAKTTPIFPDFRNQRSMLYIGNLCEFIKLIIDYDETGIFFPQNKEFVSTGDLVKTIADVHHHKIWMIRLFNPIIKLLFKVQIINKVFGNIVYEKKMSECQNKNYQVYNFEDSIMITER